MPVSILMAVAVGWLLLPDLQKAGPSYQCLTLADGWCGWSCNLYSHQLKATPASYTSWITTTNWQGRPPNTAVLRKKLRHPASGSPDQAGLPLTCARPLLCAWVVTLLLYLAHGMPCCACRLSAAHAAGHMAQALAAGKLSSRISSWRPQLVLQRCWYGGPCPHCVLAVDAQLRYGGTTL